MTGSLIGEGERQLRKHPSFDGIRAEDIPTTQPHELPDSVVGENHILQTDY
jgi:hypothetical protein